MWLQWTKRYRLCRLNSWNIRKNFNGCERDDLNGQLERKLASQLAIHINGLDSAYRLLTAWLSFGKLCFSSVALVGVFCIELNGFTFCAILRHLGVFLGDESTRSIVFTERGFQSLRLSFSLSLSLRLWLTRLTVTTARWKFECCTAPIIRLENIRSQNSCCRRAATRRADFPILPRLTSPVAQHSVACRLQTCRQMEFLNRT